MKKFKHKKLIIVCAIIVCLGISEFTGALPYIVARISSSVYIASNYPARNFKFDSEQESVTFEGLGLIYKDKDGSILGLVLNPKEFPTYVLFDSIKGNA